jgi:hypothetical protein
VTQYLATGLHLGDEAAGLPAVREP